MFFLKSKLWSFELRCSLKPANECLLTEWDKIGTCREEEVFCYMLGQITSISLSDSYFTPKRQRQPKYLNADFTVVYKYIQPVYFSQINVIQAPMMR